MFFNYINSLAVLKVITHAPLSLPPGLTSIKEQRSVDRTLSCQAATYPCDW
jgi:hypothetical protein